MQKKNPHRMTYRHTYIQCNNLAAGSYCGPKKLQAGQGPANHYAIVTASGAGLLPGSGGGSSSTAVAAASGWRRGGLGTVTVVLLGVGRGTDCWARAGAAVLDGKANNNQGRALHYSRR
jgi:hypothetical protein